VNRIVSGDFPKPHQFRVHPRACVEIGPEIVFASGDEISPLAGFRVLHEGQHVLQRHDHRVGVLHLAHPFPECERVPVRIEAAEEEKNHRPHKPHVER
jgi:hypothetical protein